MHVGMDLQGSGKNGLYGHWSSRVSSDGTEFTTSMPGKVLAYLEGNKKLYSIWKLNFEEGL